MIHTIINDTLAVNVGLDPTDLYTADSTNTDNINYTNASLCISLFIFSINTLNLIFYTISSGFSVLQLYFFYNI